MPFLNSVRGSYGSSRRFGGSNLPPALYAFTSHTFTNAGASGRNGPSLSAARSAYSSTSWANSYLNMTTNGIQEWTVPQNGLYTITAAGACGGQFSSQGRKGFGAIATTTVSLTSGQVFKIVVGQEGSPGNGENYGGGGGGGGSFVYTGNIGESGLIAVGGGAGGAAGSTQSAVYSPTNGGAASKDGQNGQTGNSGSNGGNSGGYDGNPGAGGINGNGGEGGGSGWASQEMLGGGAGWLGSAVANPQIGSQNSSVRGTRFVGGFDRADGGFGGGGGLSSQNTSPGGGGGGGYSGGGGGGWWDNGSNQSGFGGGGGSYTSPSGTNSSITVSSTSSNGYVTIVKV